MLRAATAFVFIAFTAALRPAIAQNSEPIWAGVYTAAQAERGRSVVQNHCGECHHDDLGGGDAPALAGPTFMLKWETHSVERLFHKIRDTMPTPDSNHVTNQQKLDTVAYILQQNGFPAGNTELTDTGDALGSLRMVPKGGPAPPRAGALVRAIGCLRQASASRWALTESTDPQVTTLDPLTEEERATAATAPLGTQTVQLVSVFPSPTALRGHRVLAKGLLIKTPSEVRINVMSLESIAGECGR